jgi:hypothetical protein
MRGVVDTMYPVFLVAPSLRRPGGADRPVPPPTWKRVHNLKLFSNTEPPTPRNLRFEQRVKHPSPPFGFLPGQVIELQMSTSPDMPPPPHPPPRKPFPLRTAAHLVQDGLQLAADVQRGASPGTLAPQLAHMADEVEQVTSWCCNCCRWSTRSKVHAPPLASPLSVSAPTTGGPTPLKTPRRIALTQVPGAPILVLPPRQDSVSATASTAASGSVGSDAKPAVAA